MQISLVIFLVSYMYDKNIIMYHGVMHARNLQITKFGSKFWTKTLTIDIYLDLEILQAPFVIYGFSDL